MYSLAYVKSVMGLPKLISAEEYKDVQTVVRRGVTPCTVRNTDNPTESEREAVDSYTSFATGCNRMFTRLVLGTLGRPISDASL